MKWKYSYSQPTKKLAKQTVARLQKRGKHARYYKIKVNGKKRYGIYLKK